MPYSGPDLAVKARRQILDLKPGSQIPGYTGHRPGVRFGFGNTFGELTHILQVTKEDDEEEDRNGSAQVEQDFFENEYSSLRRRFLFPDPKNDSSAVGELLRGRPTPYADYYRQRQRPIDMEISLPSGVKPGYTGFVPLLRQQLGGSYGTSTKNALQQFEDICRVRAQRQQSAGSLARTSSLPRLVPILNDDEVRERLQVYKTLHAKDTRREFAEPPVVGYQGHIPRLRPTSCNLGHSFNRAARNGLQSAFPPQNHF